MAATLSKYDQPAFMNSNIHNTTVDIGQGLQRPMRATFIYTDPALFFSPRQTPSGVAQCVR